jgi:hypothetical protein
MKEIPTIYELRKRGWKVRVGHHRKYFRYDPFTGHKTEVFLLKVQKDASHPNFYLSAKGGVTVIEITIPNHKTDYAGVAECSDEEHYRRKTGIKKAVARALSLVEQASAEF